MKADWDEADFPRVWHEVTVESAGGWGPNQLHERLARELIEPLMGREWQGGGLDADGNGSITYPTRFVVEQLRRLLRVERRLGDHNPLSHDRCLLAPPRVRGKKAYVIVADIEEAAGEVEQADLELLLRRLTGESPLSLAATEATRSGEEPSLAWVHMRLRRAVIGTFRRMLLRETLKRLAERAERERIARDIATQQANRAAAESRLAELTTELADLDRQSEVPSAPEGPREAATD